MVYPGLSFVGLSISSLQLSEKLQKGRFPFSQFLIRFFSFLSLNATQKALRGVKGNEAGVSCRHKQKERFLLDVEPWSYMVRDHLVHIFRKGWL